ncbi:MAG: chemotaxis protein CheW, partial [Spirochaetales bacterium]
MEQTLQNVAMQADINQESKEQHVNIDFKMVAFSLGGKDYAIDILKVKEIAKADRFTYVPNTSPFVIGVYNLRGEIIPIIDLRIFFNIPYDDCAENNFENMIIVGFGEQKYATIVDSIERVVGIDSASVQPPHPLFSDINIKYIYGIVENEDRMYILLDIERIFGANSAQNYEQREMRVVPHAKIASGTVPDSGPQKVSQSSQDSIPQKEKTASAVQPESVSPGAGESSVPVVFAAKNDPELKFLLESLKKFKNFNKSSVNESWVFNRFT